MEKNSIVWFAQRVKKSNELKIVGFETFWLRIEHLLFDCKEKETTYVLCAGNYHYIIITRTQMDVGDINKN